MTSDNLPESMREYAEEAVRYALGTHNIRLNFSGLSIGHIDTIVGRIYDYIPRNRISKWINPGPSDAEIEHVCQMLGAYIGEVYRRAKGGEWAMHEELGTAGVRRDEKWVFPMTKVRERFGHGPGHDLYQYFRVVLDEP
jgi:hypothetical protein